MTSELRGESKNNNNELLYRYFRINNQTYQDSNNQTHKSELNQLLEKGIIIPKTPNSFNDPFDCIATIFNSKYCIESHTAREKLDVMREATGIYCLTKSPSSTLMWSHYADSHKGICIGFDRRLSYFKLADEVIYSSNLPKINLSDNKETEIDTLSKLFLIKSTDWKHEAEYRIIFRTMSEQQKNRLEKDLLETQDLETKDAIQLIISQNGPAEYKVPVECIKEIIFGALTSNEAIENTISKANKSGIVASFYKMQLTPNSYELKKVLL